MVHFKMLILCCLCFSYFCLNNNLFAQNFWTPLGEGGGIYGGNINALAVDSNGIIYAATWGGIYRSSDNGSSWTSLGYKDEIIWDIAILEGDEIYAAGYAVYYSNDKGDSWSKRYLRFLGTHSLTISPDGRLYAGTSNGPFMFDPNTEEWTNQSSPGAIIREHGTQRLAVDSSGTIYSATAYGQEKGGLYRSTDSPDNWINITPPSGTRVVKSVEFDDNGRLWAGTGRGIFFSDDKGDNWVKVNTLKSDTYNTIKFSKDGAIYASSFRRFFVSVDKGHSWDLIFDKTVFDVGILADNSLFVATFQGVFYFDNKNESWIDKSNGITNTFIYDMAFDSNGTLYIASSVGLYSSTDDGHSFNLELREFGGKNIYATSILITENDDIFVGTTFNNGIYYKTEGYDYWQYSYVPRLIKDIVKHPSGILFAGTSSAGVFFSDDNGRSWQSTSLPNDLLVTKLLVAADGGIFVGATKAGEDNETPKFIGYYYSPHAGKTWRRTVFKEYYGTGQQIQAMIKHRNDDLFIGTAFGVYRSQDNGVNWEHIYDKHPETNYGTSVVSITDFAVSSGKNIFAGTFDGVIESEDDGNTWAFLESTGLAHKRISCVEISPSGYLFISTFGSGASSLGGGSFRSLEKVTIISDTSDTNEEKIVISQFTLSQNYPNPFNAETTIEYTIKYPGRVQVTVFNQLGQKIRVLIDAKAIPAGTYKIRWDATTDGGKTVNSGVYFYQIISGTFKTTKKVLLLK